VQLFSGLDGEIAKITAKLQFISGEIGAFPKIAEK